jgi:hypothetical protein
MDPDSGFAVMQRFAVAASCVGFGALLVDASMSLDVRFAVLAVLATLACVEKLGSVMNLVAVERDWVGIIIISPGPICVNHINHMTGGCRGRKHDN